MKIGIKELIAQASAEIVTLTPAEVSALPAENVQIIDLRDRRELEREGRIIGAFNCPRGMLEFIADPATAIHNAALTPDAPIYVVCAAGGQAALAGKTLKEMGYSNVRNIGGIGDWKAAGGAVEGA